MKIKVAIYQEGIMDFNQLMEVSDRVLIFSTK